MVEAKPTINNPVNDEDFSSEDFEDEQMDAMRDFSDAANMKMQGGTLRRAQFVRGPKFEDAVHAVKFNQELAYLRE